MGCTDVPDWVDNFYRATHRFVCVCVCVCVGGVCVCVCVCVCWGGGGGGGGGGGAVGTVLIVSAMVASWHPTVWDVVVQPGPTSHSGLPWVFYFIF